MPICYEFEFGEELSIDENGVPLEHLVTCVANVELKYGGPNKNIKYIIRDVKIKNSDLEKEGMCEIVSNGSFYCFVFDCRGFI